MAKDTELIVFNRAVDISLVERKKIGSIANRSDRAEQVGLLIVNSLSLETGAGRIRVEMTTVKKKRGREGLVARKMIVVDFMVRLNVS